MSAPRNPADVCVAFSIAASLAYALAVYKNLALFTYHPAVGEFAWGVEKARGDAPVMYWYGWICTALIAGLAAGGIAGLLPARASRRLWPDLAWLVPLAAMIFFGYILRNYFLR